MARLIAALLSAQPHEQAILTSMTDEQFQKLLAVIDSNHRKVMDQLLDNAMRTEKAHIDLRQIKATVAKLHSDFDQLNSILFSIDHDGDDERRFDA